MSESDQDSVAYKGAASSLTEGSRSSNWVIGGVIVFLIGVVGLGSTGFLTYKFLEQEKREAAWTARLESITIQIPRPRNNRLLRMRRNRRSWV
jgi:hypothetical protein